MLRRFMIISLAAATGLAATSMPASAGSMNKPPKVAARNIVGAAVSSADHKTLVAAVKAAGLVDTLASAGPFTVFAPTDAAFRKLPAGTVDTLLQPANRDQLAAILTYHVVAGRVSAAQLIGMINAGGGQASLTTVQGGTLVATIAGGKVVITDANGGTATVTKADLMQSNGVIHVTDAVSLPG
jgi:uncharacterized surface protein with fasciclin (FAS1) repeats